MRNCVFCTAYFGSRGCLLRSPRLILTRSVCHHAKCLVFRHGWVVTVLIPIVDNALSFRTHFLRVGLTPYRLGRPQFSSRCCLALILMQTAMYLALVATCASTTLRFPQLLQRMFLWRNEDHPFLDEAQAWLLSNSRLQQETLHCFTLIRKHRCVGEVFRENQATTTRNTMM